MTFNEKIEEMRRMVDGELVMNTVLLGYALTDIAAEYERAVQALREIRYGWIMRGELAEFNERYGALIPAAPEQKEQP